MLLRFPLLLCALAVCSGCFPTVRDKHDKQVADAGAKSKQSNAKTTPPKAKSQGGQGAGMSSSSGMSLYKETDAKNIKRHPLDHKIMPKPSEVSKKSMDRMLKAASMGPPSVGGKSASAKSLANRFNKQSQKDGQDDQAMGVRAIMKFDKNKDGVVETSEVPESVRQFVMVADANKDGKLTKAEIKSLQTGVGLPTAGGGSVSRDQSQGGKLKRNGLGGMLGDLLKSMDKNGDGKVELKELDPKTRDSVSTYDKNKDGILSKEELASQGNNPGSFGSSTIPNTGRGGAPGPGGTAGGGQDVGNARMLEQIMASMDKNGDGKIAVDELPLSIRRNMMKADKDKDGFISGDEFLKGFLGDTGGSVADRKKRAKMKLDKKSKQSRKSRSRSRSRRSRSRRRR